MLATMMDKLTFLYLFLAAAGVLLAVSLPLALGRVPPNRWYGFRTPGTLANRDVWYQANAESGKRLMAAAVTIAAGAFGFFFVPRWNVNHYAIANLAVTVLAIAWAVVQSALVLKRMTAQKDPDTSQ